MRELRRLLRVSVHCWGAPRDEPGVESYRVWDALSEPKPDAAALQAMSIDLAMAAGVKGNDLAHSHTWHANLGGHLAKLMWSIPHVMTIHSLEPLRPWKAEQLGGGYALSRFCERTAIESADAVIAVSRGVRPDILDGSSTVRDREAEGSNPGPPTRALDQTLESKMLCVSVLAGVD